MLSSRPEGKLVRASLLVRVSLVRLVRLPNRPDERLTKASLLLKARVVRLVKF